MSRFLVVDDSPSALRELVSLLKRDGHEVRAAAHGGDAMESLSEEHFDVVLTDLEMPVADGFAVVRAARATMPHGCRVVMTSAALEMRDELVEGGACFVDGKPFDYGRFRKIVNDCRTLGGRMASASCPMRGLLVQCRLRPV